MERKTPIRTDLFVLLGFLALASMSSPVMAQGAPIRAFERLDGPVAPIEKQLFFSLKGLDPEVRMRHSGDRLELRIDRGITDALLLQTLQEATGVAFRSLTNTTGTVGKSANASTIRESGVWEMPVDVIAEIAERPILLQENGLPAISENASPSEKEAHHALLKNLLVADPSRFAILQQEILKEKSHE